MFLKDSGSHLCNISNTWNLVVAFFFSAIYLSKSSFFIQKLENYFYFKCVSLGISIGKGDFSGGFAVLDNVLWRC